ncbi:hypothetical protein CK203_019113 [Vitis vinifera]|uniref:Uncharacterized protein n=1 Tax=Vitis vinifera TaxID=29760 RepID=A0A438J7Z7_VITVI|nr:hypothetical protein CK203_019113 [Vitis vinifera]
MSKRERDQEERGEGRRGGEEGIGEKQALNNSYLNSMVVWKHVARRTIVRGTTKAERMGKGRLLGGWVILAEKLPFLGVVSPAKTRHPTTLDAFRPEKSRKVPLEPTNGSFVDVAKLKIARWEAPPWFSQVAPMSRSSGCFDPKVKDDERSGSRDGARVRQVMSVLQSIVNGMPFFDGRRKRRANFVTSSFEKGTTSGLEQGIGKESSHRVKNDAMSSMWSSTNYHSKITDKALLVETSKYLGPFPWSFVSLGITLSLSWIGPWFVGKGACNDCCGMDNLEGEVILDPLRIILINGRALGCTTSLEREYVEAGAGYLRKMRWLTGLIRE